MTVDIRANVTCSLGVIISGSVGDDYLQGSGLIKTQGSCEISGLIAPQVGEKVIFSYNKEGLTRNIPRVLRVLSYFADPFRRVTTVELGCKLTYLSDLREPIDWTAFSEGADINSDASSLGFTKEDENIIVVPISANSVMLRCLSSLGLAASSYPLTNQFSVSKFDLSGGYVQVLSDLLVSESYFGYLDTNETLQVRSIVDSNESGPVLTAQDLIDVSPIGVGQLPGDAVTVSYSSLKLKRPEIRAASAGNQENEDLVGQANFANSTQFGVPDSTDTQGTFAPERTGQGNRLVDTPQDNEQKEKKRINWELDEQKGSSQTYYVNYKKIVVPGQPPVSFTAVYTGASYSTTFTKYAILGIVDEDTGKVEEREVVRSRFVKNYGPSISIATPFAKAYLESSSFAFNNQMIQTSGSNTYYSYYDGGAYTVTKEEVFKTAAEQGCSVGLDLKYPVIGTDGRIIGEAVITTSYGLLLTEVTVRENWTQGGSTKQSEARYKLLMDTSHGQQAIASARENVSNAEEACRIMNDAVGGFILDSYTVQSKTTGEDMRSDSKLKPYSNEKANSGASGGSYPAVYYNQPTLEGRPDSATRKAEVYSKGGNSGSGYSTASQAGLEFVSGNALAERRTDFSLPYAPDDIFVKGRDAAPVQFSFNLSTTPPSSVTWYDATLVNGIWKFILGGIEYTQGSGRYPGNTNSIKMVRDTGVGGATYTSQASDAAQKANTFGRVQNRLLLGNRNGISLQVAPERMPAAPFDPFFVSAASLSSLYRTNGTQWAFDSQGIVCSTDALYWGVAGRVS